MKNSILILLILFGLGAKAQTTTVDFVQILNGNEAETIFYYENNWKVLREEAVKAGYIESYQLVKLVKDENSEFDILLITNYGTQERFDNKEPNFRKLIDARGPGGTKMLNDKPKSEIRKIVSGRDGELLN